MYGFSVGGVIVNYLIQSLSYTPISRTQRMPFLVDSIGSKALQEAAPTPATASTTVQPKSAAPKEGLRRKKSQFWRPVYAVLGLQDLIPKAIRASAQWP